MKIIFILVLSILGLISCKPKLSERDRQFINNLKQDIEFKIDVCKLNEMIHKSYLDDPSKADRMLKYYLFQNNLLQYFEMLKMDSLRLKAIDSINFKINLWNNYLDTANFGKSEKIYLNIKPFQYQKIKDSIDLFILQNTFLFKMKELQNNAYSGFCFNKIIFNSVEILNLKKQYNLNDTLNAYLMPYDSDNLYQYKIKIYHQNNLEYEGMQNKLTLNYKPLKKGRYKIFIDGEFFYERGLNYNIENDFQIGEFEVK